MPIAFRFSPDTTAFSNAPLLKISGHDALSFVNRLCTQAIELNAASAKLLCFLDKKGRFLDVGQACAMGEDVFFLGWPGIHRLPQEVLEPFHFAEELVFTALEHDVFLVVNEPSALAPYEAKKEDGLFFWGAPSLLSGCKLAANKVDFVSVEQSETGQGAYWLFSEEKEAAATYLKKQNIDEGNFAQWQEMRVHSGWPQVGTEAFAKSNPLELALHDALSWTKGCYVGQEVISRIDNYDKQQKHLVELRFTTPFRLQTDGDVLCEGQRIGIVTSWSPCRTRALAILKIPHAEMKTAVVKVENASAKVHFRHLAQTPHDA